MKYILILLTAVAIVGIVYIIRNFILGLRFGLTHWLPDDDDIEP